MLKTLIIILLSAQVFGQVWNSQRKWDVSDIANFKSWVRTELDRDLFIEPSSPYYGIKTDCADAIFAYMAIYSLENQLYFQVKLGHNIYIDSDSNRFDHLPENERLKALVHYIGANAGTYALAYYNSYPIALRDISAGDIYIVEWEKNGKTNRHAYMIKDFIATGHFELYSSTTPVKARKLALRKGMPLHLFNSGPWGFKRIAPYYLISKSRSDYSNEQYSMRAKWGSKFLGNLSKYLAVEEDDFNTNLKRRVGNVCDMLEGRVREVESAITYKDKISRCMNSSEYYMYSTPSRDSSLMSAMTRLLVGWKKIRKISQEEIDLEINMGLDYFLGKDKSSEGREALYNLCPVKIENSSFTMRDFFMLKRANKISSNPNDPLRRRWGLNSPASKCPRY
jgi:hypothetical protein